jgi:outer membrane protein
MNISIYRFLFFYLLLTVLSEQINAQDKPLTAAEAVQIALQQNLQVQIIKNDAEIARVNNNWGMAGRQPVVSANIGDNEAITNLDQRLANGTNIKRNGVTNNSLNANVAVSWRIFNGYRVVATKQRLTELEQIGEINIRQQASQLGYEVVLNYYNIVRLNQQLKVTMAGIGLSEERVKIAETRFRVGSSPKTDLLQAQVDLNVQRMALANLQLQVQQTKAILNNLLKRDPVLNFEVADTSFNVNPVDLKEIQDKLPVQNFELLRARRDLAILLQTKREINSQRLPVVTLNGAYNFGRNQNSAGFNLFTLTYGPNLGINISIPIFNGNTVRTQLKVNEIQTRNRQLETEQLQNQLNLSIVNAYSDYTNALSNVKTETLNVALAQENNFIALERFRKLQTSSIELRQAQLSLVDAETRLINAQFRAKLAEAGLKVLVGEGCW